MTQKTTKLWQKTKTKMNPAVNKYIISKDLAADNRMLKYDVLGSIAHTNMLVSVGLLNKKDGAKIVKALKKVAKEHENGEFVLHQENEDVHTEIENYLVRELGDIGKRIHVGRSRNDQVLTAMRLLLRDEIRETQKLVKDFALTLLDFAKKHEFIPMAGFTHMQHAMPSSVGQWACAFAESLSDDFDMLDAAFKLLDQNPLGSAAGFGTAVPLNRDMTTKELGFDRTQVNSIYCQNSRGKFEAFVLHCLHQAMMTMGKIANDLVIFTSQEFDWFKVDRSLTTGSSIMPQKQNLDIMEVMRANVSIVGSLQQQVQTVTQNLISGYNKDLKITKKPILDGFEIVKHSLEICTLTFNNLTPVKENLLKAFDDVEIFAADYANGLVMEGMSFRDAYVKVGESLSSLERQDPVKNIKAKKHIGAPGNLRISEAKKKWQKR